MFAHLIPIALIGASICLLHHQGIAASKCIAAVFFMFRPGKAADIVSLDSCTGWVRHVGRFHQNRIYEFHLNCHLSNGDVRVLLLDSKKRELLRLSQHSNAVRIALNRDSRYYLHWEFDAATGKCSLRW